MHMKSSVLVFLFLGLLSGLVPKVFAQSGKGKIKMVVQNLAEGSLTSASLSEDSKYFACVDAFNNRLLIWNVHLGRIIHSIPNDPMTNVEFSKDGKYVVTGCQNGSVKVWSVSDGKLFHSFNPKMQMQFAAFAGDEDQHLMIKSAGLVSILDLKKGKIVRSLKTTQKPDQPKKEQLLGVNYFNDNYRTNSMNKRFFVLNLDQEKLGVYNTSNLKLIQSIQPSLCDEVHISSSGKYMLTTTFYVDYNTNEALLQLFDVKTAQVIDSVRMNKEDWQKFVGKRGFVFEEDGGIRNYHLDGNFFLDCVLKDSLSDGKIPNQEILLKSIERLHLLLSDYGQYNYNDETVVLNYTFKKPNRLNGLYVKHIANNRVLRKIGYSGLRIKQALNSPNRSYLIVNGETEQFQENKKENNTFQYYKRDKTYLYQYYLWNLRYGNLENQMVVSETINKFDIIKYKRHSRSWFNTDNTLFIHSAQSNYGLPEFEKVKDVTYKDKLYDDQIPLPPPMHMNVNGDSIQYSLFTKEKEGDGLFYWLDSLFLTRTNLSKGKEQLIPICKLTIEEDIYRFSQIKTSPDKKWMACMLNYSNGRFYSKDNIILVIWDKENPSDHRVIGTSKKPNYSEYFEFIDNSNILLSEGDGFFNVYDIERGKLGKEKYPIESYTDVLSQVPDSLYLGVKGDGKVDLFSLKNNQYELKFSFIKLNDNEWLTTSPDHYYYGSKKAPNSLHFVIGEKILSFEQFDLKFNRPDIILQRLGSKDSLLIRAYNRAYKKRLKKMGFTEDMLKSDMQLPELKITNFEYLPSITDSSYIFLNLHMKDEMYPLDRINLWINDVAIFGSAGISIKDRMSNESAHQLKVPLTKGQNKVEVSVLNGAGVESYKEMIELECTAGKEKPDLYVVSIGESNFEDEKYNLTYAAKDAGDISALLSKSELYGKIHSKILINEQVTRSNILELKSFLKQAGINDEVVIFIAGHGVLDENLDYYLATYDMDFENPSEKGLAYEDLEGILDGILPLKKLLVIDACHSGEIDKEEVELIAGNNIERGDVQFRTVGAKAVPKLGIQRTSDLAKSLFTDLRKGTGANVISSSGGMEFAMESAEWKNGLFTYCFINGMSSKAADLNSDGEIWLSEMQLYLFKEVSKLSNNMQRPTSRMENRAFDYRLW